MYQAVNNPMIRDYNLATVYSLVRDQGPISRAEVSRESGLSKSTVSELVEQLQSERLITEVGVSRNQIGRRSVLLDIDIDGSHVIGIHVENEGVVRAVVADGRGTIKKACTDRCESPEYIIDVMKKQVASLADEYLVRSIGIAAPGLVHENGIAFALKLKWRNLPLADPLETATGLPVFVESTARASVMAERWWGRGRAIRSFLYVGHHNTMGGALVINGTLLRGVHGAAGELGHVRVAPDGPLCICGRHGCLSTVASLKAIKLQCGMDPGMSNKAFAAHIISIERQRNVKNILERAADYIANALADMVNVLDPGYIIMSTELSESAVFVERLKETLAAEVMDQSTQGIQLETSTLGESSRILGSCAVGLQRSLEPQLGRGSAL